MQFGHRASTRWGLALSAAIHAGLGCVFLLATDEQKQARQGQLGATPPGPTLRVALIPARARAAAEGPSQPIAELPAPPPIPEVPLEPIREEARYYLPHELERQLMVKRDRSEQADIVLPHPVTMLLFVDAAGRVASISFEDQIPGPALQRALRATFMQLEFIPALRENRPVAARIKLAIAASAPTVRPSGNRAPVPGTEIVPKAN